MKIIFKYKDIEIIICENEKSDKESITTMRWSDQNKQIQETIIVMADQIKKIIMAEQSEKKISK